MKRITWQILQGVDYCHRNGVREMRIWSSIYRYIREVYVYEMCILSPCECE